MPIDYKSLGSRVKDARTSKGYTQERLAECIDLSTTHISNIENGNAIPSLKTFVDIANALSVSADPLLCDSLIHSKGIYEAEAATIFRECTVEEARILTETLRNTLNTLRKHYNTQ